MKHKQANKQKIVIDEDEKNQIKINPKTLFINAFLLQIYAYHKFSDKFCVLKNIKRVEK